MNKLDSTPLTAYEKKCATALAKAFYFTIPEFQEHLPPYREVLAMARKVIHRENASHIKHIRKNADIPLMPSTGYDYIGVDFFCDPWHDLGGDLKACLEKCLECTYDKYMDIK